MLSHSSCFYLVAFCAFSGFLLIEASPYGTRTSPVVKSTKRSTTPLPIEENFDLVASLPSLGWEFVRDSITSGQTFVFQGYVNTFGPQNSTGYVAMNYESVTGTDTISTWIMSPEISLNSGSGTRIFFYTRTIETPALWPDRLYLKYSTAGASTTPSDFAEILISVNPDLTSAAYPSEWTLYSGIIPAQSEGVTGRFAFHYNVPNGGPTGTCSNYIGIDSVYIDTPAPSVTPTPSITPTLSPSPSITPSLSPTPSSTSTPSSSSTPSPSVSPSSSPTPSTSSSTTPSISVSSSPGASKSVTPSPSVTPSVTPSAVPSVTPSPSASPSSTPSASPSFAAPSVSRTPTPDAEGALSEASVLHISSVVVLLCVAQLL